MVAPPPMDDLLRRVTYHAVTRYVQRVLGQPVVANEQEIGTKACAEAHCLAASTSIDAVRAAILNPFVVAALLSGGHTQVRCREFGVKIRPDTGVICTVYVVKAPQKRKQSFPSKRESRRITNHLARRARGRPSTVRGER